MHSSFDLSPQLDDVDKVVQALRVEVEPILGVQQARAFEVAVSEALTNIVVHGYKDNADGADISINLSKSGQVLQLTIRDHGLAAPSDLYENVPSLDEIDIMQESGRGLALIRHHTDTVTYMPALDGNRLVLTFNPANQSLQDGAR